MTNRSRAHARIGIVGAGFVADFYLRALQHVRGHDVTVLAARSEAKGREVAGHNDIRCTVSIGGFVPKPHTPFQWAAQLDVETTDERPMVHPTGTCVAQVKPGAGSTEVEITDLLTGDQTTLDLWEVYGISTWTL